MNCLICRTKISDTTKAQHVVELPVMVRHYIRNYLDIQKYGHVCLGCYWQTERAMMQSTRLLYEKIPDISYA